MNVYVQNSEIFEKISKAESFLSRGFSFELIDSFKDVDILKFLLKNKKKEAIYINELGNISFVYKRNQTWKFIDVTTFDLFFCFKRNLINLDNSDEKNRNILLEKFIPNLNNFNRYPFFEQFGIEILEEQLIFLMDENWNVILKEFAFAKNFLTISKTTIKKNELYTKTFFDTLERDQKAPGIGVCKVIKRVDTKSIQFTIGKTVALVKNKNERELSIFLVSNSDDALSSFYLNKGLNENIRNNLLNNKTSGKKMKKRDIIISLIGFIIFILLTIYTFTIIFDPSNTEKAVEIIFDKRTFAEPWIYLLWFNFIITFSFSFIIMSIITYIYYGKKPDFNMILAFFVATQLRMATRFITGEEIIGTIIWIWYINKNTIIRSSTLVGTMASMALIRIPVTFIIKVPFMIMGQVYASNIFGEILSNDATYDLGFWTMFSFYFLSWGGFVWELLHNSIIPIIILFPFAHKTFNLLYSKFILLRNESNVISKLETREMSILSMKKTSKELFKRKDRIYRIIITMLFMIFLEAFEIMYIYKIVENSMYFNGILDSSITEKAKYTNFMSLSGIRLMATSIHSFPLINVIPGNSMGIMEYFLSRVNEAVFITQHNFDPSISSDIARNFAEQSAFITRFFNTYLSKFLSITIALFIIFKMIARKISG